VQIAKDAGFLEALSETQGAGPDFTLPSLPGDTYFVRVSAYDRFGLEGSAQTYAFERRRNQISGTVDTVPSERRFRFRWDGVADGTPQFRLQLVRIGSPDVPVVDEAGLSAHMLSVSNLPAGDYSWRVSSTLIVKGQLLVSWTPAQTLHVGK
jgi:hypothetical protein